MSADERLSVDERSGWECRFCSEKLEPLRLLGWRRLLWIVPVRAFRCPHCFNRYLKPAACIAAIPIVGKLFCEKRGVAAGVSAMISSVVRRGKDGPRKQRDYVSSGWFVRFARWTSSVETKTSECLGRVFRSVSQQLLWPFHWFSKTFLRSHHDHWSSHRSKSKKKFRSHKDDHA